MGRTTAHRPGIKRVFDPISRARAFPPTCAVPRTFAYRRIEADQVYVFDIQWEKYGRPRFVVNFGKAPVDGVVDVLGKPVGPEDVLPSHGQVRGRLQPGSGAMTGSWFRQDRPLIERLVSGPPSALLKR